MVLSVILKGKAENMEKREWRYSGTIEERTSIREQVHDVLARKVAEEAMVLLKMNRFCRCLWMFLWRCLEAGQKRR